MIFVVLIVSCNNIMGFLTVIIALCRAFGCSFDSRTQLSPVVNIVDLKLFFCLFWSIDYCGKSCSIVRHLSRHELIDTEFIKALVSVSQFFFVNVIDS